jgi:hypothetical protein
MSATPASRFSTSSATPHEIETRPLRWFNESLHLVEIALAASREIVEPVTR